jgi:TPP-dependent pyruvate/acetoin dehydrogenase alpha subunit
MATLERHRIIVADGQQPLPPGIDRETVLRDYRICWESRHASLLGRREVLTGKAKFGIFGDGKEVAQVAMAKAFRPGDWRSGYYRDQTLLMALGLLTLEQFFAQLYAHADEEAEPASAGRQMNCHFGMRLVNPDGSWRVQTTQVNIASDISPTGSQMPRLVGLAYASRLYRELPELRHMTAFSNNGEEIAWGTIGNATCAEGMFWEAVNAIGVLRAPAIISIWDDGYGISVPNEYQVTKGNISALLEGFRRTPGGRDGFDLYVVRGWDYPALVSVYQQAAEIARREHVPAIVHVIELTQPQGHSTSGSHERYKPPERLQWEREYDCLVRMRLWILEQGLASAEELDAIERAAAETVRQAKERAWRAYQQPILEERAELASLLQELAAVSAKRDEVLRIRTELLSLRDVLRRDLSVACNRALIAVADEPSEQRTRLVRWRQALEESSSASATVPISTARLRYRLCECRRFHHSTAKTPRWSTASRSSTPASMPRFGATRAWSSSAKTSGAWAMSTKAAPDSKPNTASCASAIPASANAPSSGKPSGWHCAGCARLPKSSTWTTCSTRCRSCPTISPPSAGAARVLKRLRSSSARVGIGWRGSGTPAPRWRGFSIWCAACSYWSRAT